MHIPSSHLVSSTTFENFYLTPLLAVYNIIDLRNFRRIENFERFCLHPDKWADRISPWILAPKAWCTEARRIGRYPRASGGFMSCRFPLIYFNFHIFIPPESTDKGAARVQVRSGCIRKSHWLGRIAFCFLEFIWNGTGSHINEINFILYNCRTDTYLFFPWDYLWLAMIATLRWQGQNRDGDLVTLLHWWPQLKMATTHASAVCWTEAEISMHRMVIAGLHW